MTEEQPFSDIRPENQKEEQPASEAQAVEVFATLEEDVDAPPPAVEVPAEVAATDPAKIERALSRRMTFSDSRARAAAIKKQQEQVAAQQRRERRGSSWTLDRKTQCCAMLGKVITQLVPHCAIAGLLSYRIYTQGPTVKECSEYQYNAMWWIDAWFIYLVARQIPFMLFSLCGPKPYEIYKGCFTLNGMFVDSWVLLVLNIYVSIWLGKPNECTEEQIGDWSTIVLILNIVLWVYNAAWLLIASCLGCMLSIFLCVLCCALCAGGNQRQNFRINGRTLDELRGDLQNRVPGAASAIEMLDQKKHSYGASTDKSKEATTCIICSEDFKETDEVVELECDDRHIFHYECISRWMATKTECPICRQKVAIH